MSSNSRLPLFQFNVDSKTKPPSYPPPAMNVSSNGLFSTQSTPQGNRFQDSPINLSLFAGATPAAKPISSKPGGSRPGGGLFSGTGKPAFNLNPPGTSATAASNKQPMFSLGALGLSPPKATRPGCAAGRHSSPLSDEEYAAGGSPRIYEDDSRGEPTAQDDEDEDTGMFGDEEDFAEDDTMQDDSPQAAGRNSTYKEEVGAAVKEPGTLVLRTEELMEELANLISPPPLEDDAYNFNDDDMDMDMDQPTPPSRERKQEILGKTSKAFLKALHDHLPKPKKTKADSNLHNAYYIASLVLPLHHSTANTTEVLRKWLYTHHANPSRSQLTSVRGTHPNSAFSVDFWDVVYRLVLRGEVREAEEVLRSANWDLLCNDAPPVTKPAFNAQQISDKRYTRVEIDSIKSAVTTAKTLLERCPGQGRSAYQPSSQFFPTIQPAVDSPGNPADWRIWRGEVLKASEELKGLTAEQYTIDDDTEESYYDAYHPAGNRGGSFGFTHAWKPRKAKVPSDISRALRNMYEVMLGDTDAILIGSEIWHEAVVGLMMWTKDVDSTDADDDEEFEDSIDINHMGPGEYYTVLLYRKQRQLVQLSSVLDLIANEMPLNPTESLEIAAGGVMAGDPTFISEVETYSPLVTAAIIEIGGWAGWVQRETAPVDPLSGRDMGLDEDDFAVLGMGGIGKEKGDIAENALRRYASSLFGTTWINEDAEIEGWEVGVGLLSRIKDGKQLAGKLLTSLPLTSTPRIEKLLTHATEARLPQAAAKIAYNWAQHLQSITQSHGDVLHFLSLAAPFSPNARKGLHESVTVLLRRSLQSSTPFPAPEHLDPRLRHLLSSPTECSSEILRFELSGYAALRTFYALRETAPETAVKALTAVIRAAGEQIDGGIWDKEWESPVEPVVLPAVLKELLPYVNALGTQDALDIAKVLTDWEGCGESLRRACVEVSEGSWVDVGKDEMVGVVKQVREAVCKVLARGWVKGGI